jgi:predicted nucleotide-binding protein
MTTNLRLDVDEFNIEPTAGIHTTERLQAMLWQAGLAFIIMTGEDTLADGTIQARPNVIHEVGLFQGSLGTRRAIVMHEADCAGFSNIDGLTTIHFPKDNLAAKFEDVRGVLVREGYLAST